MLKQPQPRAGRRRAGILVLGATLAACSYAAWAVRPAAPADASGAIAAGPAVLPAAVVAPMSQTPAPPAPPAPPAAPPSPAPPAPAKPPTAPLAPSMAPPKYPAEAASTGQSGRVVLKLLVRTDGSVKDVVVERSEPAGVFDAAAVEAARKWELTPGMKDGQPVEGWVRVPIEFEAPAPQSSGPSTHGDGATAQWMRVDGPVKTLACDTLVVDGDVKSVSDVRCGVAAR